MKFDYHTHHERCGHAEGSIRSYIEAAVKEGLDIIGISDHSPYLYHEKDQPFPGIAMAKSEFDHYVQEILSLKKEYEGKIDVLLGVESDFFPNHAEMYKSFYAKYPLDYVIGSVHYVDGISIFNKNRWDGLTNQELKQTKDRYYELVEHSAKSGMFQILGHIDAMKGYYPSFSEIPSEAVDQTLKSISKYDIAIEINTSGKNKDCGGWYPADDILERALFHGTDVTFGSDAHVPQRVGDEFEMVKMRLKEIGFKEWAYFKQKKKYRVDL